MTATTWDRGGYRDRGDKDQNEIRNGIKTGFRVEIEAGVTRLRDGIGDEDGIRFRVRIRNRGQTFGIQVDMAMIRSC
jgi:hypothetical protein